MTIHRTLKNYLWLAVICGALLGTADALTPHAPVWVASAHAQGAEQAPPVQQPASETPELKKSLVDYYWDGGSLMHPILLCSVIMFSLIGELIFRLRLTKVTPPVIVQQLRDLFAAQNYQEAWRVCISVNSFLTNVLAPSLERLGRGRDTAERVMLDHGLKEASALRTRIVYLSVLAVIAPMLGLLGTVQGMIMAFEIIAQGGLGDPGKLAHSIGIALITTFAGLVVGIPSMFFYYFFRNRLAKVTTSVEDIINELFEDIPFEELQGVKIGYALEEELKAGGAPMSAPAYLSQTTPTAVLPAVSAPAPVRATVTMPPPPGLGKKVTMVGCPNCRALILPGSKTCPNCRAELDWA